MTVHDADFRQQIFDLLWGNLNLEEYPVLESAYVKNEFSEGSFCAVSYAEMLDAYSRICQRLHVEEWADEDVEIIINSLLAIGKEISMKMFEYGVFFACQDNRA